MAIHTRNTIVGVLHIAGKASKKDVFHACYRVSHGAIRPAKLEKAWKQLAQCGILKKTPSNTYTLALS